MIYWRSVMAKKLIVSAAERIITLLVEQGWQEDGATRTEHVRIGTSRSPVYGGIGGEARTFGGRQRFRKPDSDLYVTVGRNSVCFYHKRDGQAIGFRSYSTGKDFDAITQASTVRSTDEMP
jgi:hypothetical protein